MTNNNDRLDRRGFLRVSTVASAAAFLGVNKPAVAAQRAGGGGGGYRALVVLNLGGGADTHAFLVPTGAQYGAYALARGPLAVGTGDLLPLPTSGTGGLALGMHARLARMKSLYDQGRMAWLPNVGSLVEPLDATQYQQQQKRFPRHLFSHNSQADFWQQGRADRDVAIGWAGQAADLLSSGNTTPVSLNISTSDAVRMQVGRATSPYTIRPTGVASYPSQLSGARGAAFDALLQQDQHPNPLVREAGRAQRHAQEQHAIVAAALAGAPVLNTPFPTPNPALAQFNLAGQLRMVARLISARQALGAQRQIFFVSIGGWDTHNDPNLGAVQDLMTEIDGALGAFDDALGELNMRQDVTTMVISEFGRSLTSNGRGSDHGWGGHYMVFGDAVDGGRLHGAFPDLTLGGPRDSGAGRLVPTISVDQYTATGLAWLGLSPSQLAEVYPTLSNFPTSTLGFLA